VEVELGVASSPAEAKNPPVKMAERGSQSQLGKGSSAHKESRGAKKLYFRE
jgi:hypothetical protein